MKSQINNRLMLKFMLALLSHIDVIKQYSYKQIIEKAYDLTIEYTKFINNVNRNSGEKTSG